MPEKEGYRVSQTPLLFGDGSGLAGFGGIASGVTAVAQVTEQLLGSGRWVAMIFSGLIAVYLSKRSLHMPLLDCCVWVPIYACVIFITALGLNNLVGLSKQKQSVPLDQYKAKIFDMQKYYEDSLENKDVLINEYKAVISKLSQSIEKDRDKVSENSGHLSHSQKRTTLFSFSSLLGPQLAYAQTDRTEGEVREPTTPETESIEELRRQLEEAEREYERRQETIEQERPEHEIEQKEKKIWQKW